MTQLYASVAIGTAATLLATILFLLRAEFYSHRLVVSLTRWWVATTPRTSGTVLALLCATAISCFALIADKELTNSRRTSPPSGLNLRSEQTNSSDVEDDSSTGEAVEALRAYADQIDSKSTPTVAGSPEASPGVLPDVDTMIAKLVARLEKQPNDVNGWKMLGWSYLNMNRPAEAAKAYETALKLEPGNAEIKKGLDAARSAELATAQSSPSNSTSGPTADDIQSAESLSDAQRTGMIRHMVDRLAARLETSPNDEHGWLRLMSSRTTLGERDAAKLALARALAVFANDSAAKTRLIGAAHELGLEPD
jgi:cytochrome c-type biogenesis protein CcmH